MTNEFWESKVIFDFQLSMFLRFRFEPGTKCEYFVFFTEDVWGLGVRVGDGRNILQSYQCPNNF